MKSKAKKIGIYLVCVVICISYLYVILLSEFPNVSSEYYAYYIKGTLNKWPGNDGLNYELGVTKDFSNTDETGNQGKGWSFSEVWGSWTDGNEATLYFSTPVATDEVVKELKLIMNTAMDISAREIEIHINGNKVDSKIIEQKNTYSTNIPLEHWYLDHTINEVKLLFTEEVKSPKELNQSDDERKIGIPVESICIVG